VSHCRRQEEKEKQGLAERKKGRLDVGDIFIEPAHREQHAVHVLENGKAYTVYINSNPAVSQAINGTNIVDPHKDFAAAARATRWMAANMTTRSPLFVASNFSRDIIFTASILPVKEDGKYTGQFMKNIPKASAALHRYLNGKADMNRPEDRYMYEYIMNGAKTGFSQIVNLQRIQKQIERDIKNGNQKNMFAYLSDAVGNVNDFAENLSRFSVYVTSRQQCRGIIQSVSNAKEVTVNFNRKGAGGYGGNLIRPVYLFFNAAVQGASQYFQGCRKASAQNGGAAGRLFRYRYDNADSDGNDWRRRSGGCLLETSGLGQAEQPLHLDGERVYQDTVPARIEGIPCNGRQCHGSRYG
jgi:hypothetical protein